MNSTTYFKLKMTLMGGYRGMSGYWNEYGTILVNFPFKERGMGFVYVTRLRLTGGNWQK